MSAGLVDVREKCQHLSAKNPEVVKINSKVSL
jgi:hypothetical protein